MILQAHKSELMTIFAARYAHYCNDKFFRLILLIYLPNLHVQIN